MKEISKDIDIDKIRAGNAKEIGNLLMEFYPSLYSVGKKYPIDEQEVKDIISEMFIKILTKKDDLFKTVISQQSHDFEMKKKLLEFYLYRIFRNFLLDRLRSKKKHTRFDKNIDVIDDTISIKLDDELEDIEKYSILNRCINLLSPLEKELVNSFYSKDKLSVIAEEFGYSLTSIRQRRHRALQKLKKLVNKELNKLNREEL